MRANGGGESVWNPPRQVSEAQILDAKLFVNAVLEARPPAPREYLADRCASLLAHFFSGATGEKLNAMAAADWLKILAPFPAKVLNAAVQRWLETNTGKPKPHDIRELCISFYGLAAWNQVERARMVADMMPSAISGESSGSFEPPEGGGPPPEDYTKTDEKKIKIAAIMHNAKLPHSPAFCEQCKKESAQ